MSMHEYMYNNFFLKSKEDAENLHNDMLMLIDRYGYITIYDYYKLARNYGAIFGCDTVEYARYMKDCGWGDEILFLANWVLCKNGHWKMVMPEPENLFEDDEEPEMPNDISKPDYYKSEGIEVIDVIKAFTNDLAGAEAFATGNIIKYACRWKKKNGVADLKKILWYTQYLIDSLSEKGNDTVEERFIVDKTFQPPFKIHGLIFENEEKGNG